MQNNIQHRITGLLNAYKRNRRWKILTIILSVAVLCNTFYAMRQAAVAVTEQNAETSQIDQILGIEGQQTTGQESVAPGTGGSIETVPAPTPTPVATDPLPTTPVGTDPATTDPVITGGGEATTDPAVIPETGATDPSGTGITGSIGGLVVPEGEEVILPADAYGTGSGDESMLGSGKEASESDLMLFETRDASLRAIGSHLQNAKVTGLAVKDIADNRLVNELEQNSLALIEVSWSANSYNYWDFAEGNYIEIQLPDGFVYNDESFTQKQVPESAVRIGSQMVNPGEVATVNLEGDRLLITFGSRAGYVLAGNSVSTFFPGIGYYTYGDPWMTISLSAEADQTGTFTPQAWCTGGSNANIPVNNAGGAITVKSKDPNDLELNGVQLTALRVNGVPGGTGVTIGSDDVFKIDVLWSWESLTDTLTSGNYFEVMLPKNLHFEAVESRFNDTQGNVYSYRVYQREADKKWMLRVVYEDISGGNTWTQGYVPMHAFIDTDDVTFDLSGRATVDFEARVTGTSEKAYASVVVLYGSSIEPGVWRLRRGTTTTFSSGDLTVVDYFVGNTNTLPIYVYNGSSAGKYANTVQLFTVASHGDMLVPDPFTDTHTVDYHPGVNYMVAYCADSTANPPAADGGTDAYYPERYSTFDLKSLADATLSNNIYNGYIDGSWSGDRKAALQRIMSTAYPYVDLETMRSNLGVSYDITAAEATSAVQGAVWKVINGYAKANTAWNSGGVYKWVYDQETNQTITSIDDLMKRLINYEPAKTEYRFIKEPDIQFNTEEHSATVTGQIGPAPVTGISGRFWSGGSDPVSVTVNRDDGTFRATLYNVKPTDSFDIHFTGNLVASSQVLYFDNKYAASGKTEQDLIAANVTWKPFSISKHWDGIPVAIEVVVIKEWQDLYGNTIVAPPGQTVTIELHRATEGGEKTLFRRIELSEENSFTWSGSAAKFDGDGNTYTYSVEEISVPTGYKLLRVDKEETATQIILTAINAEMEETTKVSVVKSWEGLGDNVKKVASHVVLYRTNAGDTERKPVFVKGKDVKNGVLTGESFAITQVDASYEPVAETLNDSNSWKLIIEGLPKYEEDGSTPARYVFFEDYFDVSKGGGQSIRYFVNPDGTTYYEKDGVRLPGEFTVGVDPQPSIDNEEISAVIHNTASGSLKVVKKWRNYNGDEWTARFPDSVTVKLGARNKTTAVQLTDEELAARLKLTSADGLYANLSAPEWTAGWNNIPAGDDIDYFVYEVKINTSNNITNYELYDPVKNVVLDGKPVLAILNPNTGIWEVTLYNRRKPTEIELVKQDPKENKTLAGAEFRLYKSSTEIPTTDSLEEVPGTYPIRTGEDGKVKITNLIYFQTYVLEETKAPDGYHLKKDAEKIVFRLIVNSDDGISKIAYLKDGKWVEKTDRYMTMYVDNERTSYTLPEAGGVGTKGYMAGGMSLITATLLMYMTLKFMQKTRKRGASK